MVKIFVGVKRVDKRRMDDMRVEIGVKESVKKKFVRSTWAGHEDRMGNEKLVKRADAQKDERK